MSNKNNIEITNINGTVGTVKGSDGMSIGLKPPLLEDPSDQLTPKHLIGMAWSTCLNATIESILEANDIDKKSRVRVDVESKRNREHGLHYILIAYAAIEDYDEDETLRIAKSADRLCPISKLIAKNEFVSLEYEEY